MYIVYSDYVDLQEERKFRHTKIGLYIPSIQPTFKELFSINQHQAIPLSQVQTKYYGNT